MLLWTQRCLVGSDEQWYGTCENYYFKKVELNRMEWCYWEEVKNICRNCKKSDCFTCERWEIVKDKLKFNHEVNRYGFQPALFRVRFYLSARPVDRQYLIEFVNQCYVDQENNCGFCKKKSKCHFCKGFCW